MSEHYSVTLYDGTTTVVLAVRCNLCDRHAMHETCELWYQVGPRRWVSAEGITERITETDIADPERERYDSWAQCSQCHRPDVAIDQRDGMCADCYVAVTAP